MFCGGWGTLQDSKRAMDTENSQLVPGRLTFLFHILLDSQNKDASALGGVSGTEPHHRAPITLLTVKKKP